MANPTIAWMSSAAYLYVLHLDESQLAWEYLRRNPIYRQDWLHSRADPLIFPVHAWGLQFRREPGPRPAPGPTLLVGRHRQCAYRSDRARIEHPDVFLVADSRSQKTPTSRSATGADDRS
jgi:hypothetical protein